MEESDEDKETPSKHDKKKSKKDKKKSKEKEKSSDEVGTFICPAIPDNSTR